MKNKCIDPGTVQAYLDGELKSDFSEQIVKHLASCEECAHAVAKAEDENSLAFTVLDGELNVLVPTERLRTKVFESIDEIERAEKVTLWGKVTETFAFLGEIDLLSPSAVALAATVLFVGTFAFALKFFPRMVGPNNVQVAESLGPVIPALTVERLTDLSSQEDAVSEDEANLDQSEPAIESRIQSASSNRPARYQKAVYRSGSGRAKSAGIRRTRPVRRVPAVNGEDIYLQTIATLNKNIDENKDYVLRPSERVEFERNLAMVDHAIKKIKQEVRKNPKNKAAKELLKTSYQNKIDLLNSVSEKNELMASID